MITLVSKIGERNSQKILRSLVSRYTVPHKAPPSAEDLGQTDVDILRFENGKIVETCDLRESLPGTAAPISDDRAWQTCPPTPATSIGREPRSYGFDPMAAFTGAREVARLVRNTQAARDMHHDNSYGGSSARPVWLRRSKGPRGGTLDETLCRFRRRALDTIYLCLLLFI